MPDTYHNIESRIVDAIFELTKYKNLNIATVACQFNVPAKRLINWWRGHKSKIECGGHNKALFKAQGSALCQYLDNLDERWPKTRYKQLEQAANSLLKKGYIGSEKLPIVGAHWTARFLQRHPQYVLQKQKPLVIKRKNVHKLETFQTHFEDYCSVKVEKGIHNEDTYNFDDTGFRVGVDKD